MKRILFLSTVILCLSCKNKIKRKSNDLVQQNLSGRVQHLEETTFDLDSAGNNKIISVRIIDFDEDGYATKYIDRDATGKIVMNETAIHYSNGAIKEFLNAVDGKQVSKMSIDIDKEGNYSAVRTYDSADRQESYYSDIRENDYGIIYAAKQHFMNGNLESGFDLKYDKANIVGGTYTDSLGKVSYSFTSKLNDRGDAIDKVSTTFNDNSPQKEIITYKYDSYDAAGNWLQQTTYNDKGKPIQIVKRKFNFY
jgi:hypothetical protein